MSTPAKPQDPQISFVEAEVEDMVKYMNFMVKETGGKVPLEKMNEFNQLTNKMVALVKKIENHVLEVKRVVQAPKDK